MDVRERRRAAIRADILAAAWRLAQRDGIAGISLRDIADEVGMRAPSLYTYVDSKNAIYDAMFAEGYQQLLAMSEAAEVDVDDPVGALTAMLEYFIDFCQASVPRYQLMFTRALPDWEPSPAAYSVSVRVLEDARRRLATLGIDSPAGLDTWTAIAAGFAAQQVANDLGGDRWRRLARDTARMFLDHHMSEDRR